MPLFIVSPLIHHALVQWKATPQMRMEDAYKWLFHATLGGEHAVTDEAGPRQWLDREWGGLGKPFPHEPEFVPLDPEGELIRVNLRPYKARGGDKATILAVFVRSARAFHVERRQFVKEWQALGAYVRKHPVGRLTYPEWTRVDRENRPFGYPAIDHSNAYERAYHPAYRVVLRSLYKTKKGQ